MAHIGSWKVPFTSSKVFYAGYRFMDPIEGFYHSVQNKYDEEVNYSPKKK
jgi:hypothetical protein